MRAWRMRVSKDVWFMNQIRNVVFFFPLSLLCSSYWEEMSAGWWSCEVVLHRILLRWCARLGWRWETWSLQTLQLTSMSLAVRSAAFRKEALSLQVLLAHLQNEECTMSVSASLTSIMLPRNTYRAVEALTVIVVRQRLHPAVARLHREAARKALGGEQLVPVRLAVRLALLEEERTVAEQLAAVRAREALRMEVLADGVQTVALQQKPIN